MSVDINLYQDREQSYVKHLFLTKYLQALAYKTLQGRSETFNFVDAFAGPWMHGDRTEYSDTSFDQAIKTLEDVRSDLGRNGRAGLKLRFCLCERRMDAAKELQRYADKHANFKIQVFAGEFEDNLDAISKALPDGFTFTFIDPTGWDIRSEKVFQFLREQNGEFILNFMADHINRHAGYEKVSASIGRFLADPDWKERYEALPAEWSSEKCILHLLKEKMRAEKVVFYHPDFSIMLPRQERRKMRLVLGTRSPKGPEVFRDVQWRVERAEIELRNGLRKGDSPQVSLFSEAYIAELQQGASGVGCLANQRLAAECAMDRLKGREQILFGSLAPEVMSEVPIRMTQVKNLMVSMKKSGVISYELPPKKSKPQEDTQVRLVV